MWRLSNAFTSAFKKLDPVPQFKATPKLGEFLAQSLLKSIRPPFLKVRHANWGTLISVSACTEPLCGPEDMCSKRAYNW
jgi:hypothetical protein